MTTKGWPQELTNETIATGSALITDEWWSGQQYQWMYSSDHENWLIEAAAETFGDDPDNVRKEIRRVYVEIVRTTEDGLKLFTIDADDTLHYLDREHNHLCDWQEE